MKSKILCLLAIGCLPLSILAQKVDLDRFNFTASVRSLPAVRIDTSYRTYSVSVETTRLMQNYLQEIAPEKSVIMEGWRMLDKNGHLQVSVKLEDLLPESFATRERVEIIKDRTGKQTGTRTFYYQEVTYTFAAIGEVNDYKGVHILDMVLADRGSKRVYRGPEFQVKQLAEGYFMMNALKITGDLYRSCVRNAINNLSNTLDNNYGFGERTLNDYMWILDSRKHPEYTAHRKAFLVVKDAMFDLRADKPIDDVREKLQPVIKYFESIKKNYAGSSKHDRKLRYASYFNLAVIYYYLDDPQSMMREASGLILNDFDARDGRGFEQVATGLKNLFQQSGIYTRHFPIDINSFKGPYESSEPVVTK